MGANVGTRTKVIRTWEPRGGSLANLVGRENARTEAEISQGVLELGGCVVGGMGGVQGREGACCTGV